MFWKLLVLLELGIFTVLSATDWVFTFVLLNTHPEAVETNPFAAACLELHGWTGLALYKVGGVLVFVGAIFLLVRRRPVVAAGVVALGCAVLLSVTTYTHTLLCDAQRDTTERAYQAEPSIRDSGTDRSTNAPPTPQCWITMRFLLTTAPLFAELTQK